MPVDPETAPPSAEVIQEAGSEDGDEPQRTLRGGERGRSRERRRRDAPAAKKKTRRGSRGGKNRRKKTPAAARRRAARREPEAGVATALADRAAPSRHGRRPTPSEPAAEEAAPEPEVADGRGADADADWGYVPMSEWGDDFDLR